MKEIHQKIAVVGLGYVGLPLAVEFGKKRGVLGFDINSKRIADLRAGKDETLEITPEDLLSATGLAFSDDIEDLRACSIFIVTVPTPIDASRRPNLTPLLGASETVGKVLKRGDIVIYESTVYPGATEEDCVPVLERASSLTFNRDFFVGYSPERINPGDRSHRLTTIVKVTSGSTPATAEVVDALYSSIVTAGTHKAPSIRVAEAAKVIENTQRDLNIALVNELALVFDTLGLNTAAVLEAAATKWNFLPFQPGLVGGHCIGVDPYYLTDKAQRSGYHPELILAGRRLNDEMGSYVAQRAVKELIRAGINPSAADALVLGFTFKEDCPDVRNTKVIDVVNELECFSLNVDVYDPLASYEVVEQEYRLALTNSPQPQHYDLVLLAVPHADFLEEGEGALFAYLKNEDSVFVDLKSRLKSPRVTWSL